MNRSTAIHRIRSLIQPQLLLSPVVQVITIIVFMVLSSFINLPLSGLLRYTIVGGILGAITSWLEDKTTLKKITKHTIILTVILAGVIIVLSAILPFVFFLFQANMDGYSPWERLGYWNLLFGTVLVRLIKAPFIFLSLFPGFALGAYVVTRWGKKKPFVREKIAYALTFFVIGYYLFSYILEVGLHELNR